MIDVLALAAMLGAVSRPALCAPRTTSTPSAAPAGATPWPGRRSAPVVELATLSRRCRAVAVRHRVRPLWALLSRVAGKARLRRLPSPPALDRSDVHHSSGLLPDAARSAGVVRRPQLGRRPPIGVLRAPGARISLDDGRDLDFQFRSTFDAPAGIVRTGDHLDAMRITGPDGRIHVPAEEHGRVAFDLATSCD